MAKRLFFGIGLDEHSQAHIDAWLQAQIRARKAPTRRQNWHLTLAFLGQVEAPQEAELVTFARQLQVPAFSLNFAHTGYWAGNGIFYLRPEPVPLALRGLAEPLRALGAKLGLHCDRQPFAPHITLFRGHKGEPEVHAPVAPFTLQVKAFHLYHSYRCAAQGLIYRPLQSFHLPAGD
ncbi:RNA 2',3'-cyclic phosphodiesterase [Pseudoalteromonas sp. OOF1S-7]|uniref:RNA 2',3'-cyclic phosphodiesterase n=1 Tax=Pseudoalteromonas sp. OOF1S-7 TaxID=2917757 RepID=UPI001EF40F17|nr:RNA 2',3'-cyclic phosphodiesterase [Pseudoalteromonas sp. OOF1S-7]MCG7536127.1 RNA 2',3'-cyclic phosphodiesterase [Pseudoalteromonas sp. OOF1S-7]